MPGGGVGTDGGNCSQTALPGNGNEACTEDGKSNPAMSERLASRTEICQDDHARKVYLPLLVKLCHPLQNG